MNVAMLMVVADETVHNYREGQVIAERRDDVWQDPFGGLFSSAELEALDEVAIGRSRVLRMEGVREPRIVAARLAVKF